MDVAACSAPVPTDEADRLADLYAYEILDSDPEEPFDDLVLLASQICSTPWAVVNFIDAQRQWTKAVRGLDGGDTPREVAFCPHTIVAPGGFLLVEDTLSDNRFAANPLVVDDPGIRFYAGSTIQSSTGRPIGTVCVVDSQPRTLTRDQADGLRVLSKIATTQLELRRLLTGERKLVDDLRELDRQKAEFTAVVAHDFRSPLTSIRGYAELLREDAIPPTKAIDAIERGSERLLRLVDDLTGSPGELEREPLDLADLARAAVEIARPAAGAGDVRLELDVRPTPVAGDGARLAQVLDNLLGNAVKYSPHGSVRVAAYPRGDSAVLDIADTGVGIPETELARLFDRFFRASTSSGFAGTGIGLSTVKALVDAHGGTIEVESRVGGGTTFRVELPAR